MRLSEYSLSDETIFKGVWAW